jgi:hypothetical protein
VFALSPTRDALASHAEDNERRVSRQATNGGACVTVMGMCERAMSLLWPRRRRAPSDR